MKIKDEDIFKHHKKISDDLKTSKNAIKKDRFDERLYIENLEQNQNLYNVNDAGSKIYPPFADLFQDVFSALYKYRPEKEEESRLEMDHQLNAQIIDAVLESDKYKELRNMTRLDSVSTTFGMGVLGPDLKDFIEELKDEYEKLMEQIQQAEAGAAEAEQGDGEGEEGGAGKGKAQEEISYEEAQKRLEEYKKKFSNMLDKTKRNSINKMLERAKNEAAETLDTITNWGLEQSPDYITSSYQDKIKLLDKLRNSPKLKLIAQLAGRYKRLALSVQREKVRRGNDQLYDIKQGADIGKLIPSELMKLKHPLTRQLFMKDFLERKTLQYETRGKEKKQRGAIVLNLDSSGSMSGQAEINY